MIGKNLIPIENKYLWTGAIILDQNNQTWVIKKIAIEPNPKYPDYSATYYTVDNGATTAKLTRKQISHYKLFI
jgi:hypothetical protein